MKNLRDLKLNVKPLIITLHHEYVFEGPCRAGSGEQLTKEYDLMMSAERVKGITEDIDKNLRPIETLNILEPTVVDRDEEFRVADSLIDQLLVDDAKTDVYIIYLASRCTDLLIPFAQKSGKPIVLLPSFHPLQMICAGSLNARGIKVNAFLTFEDTAAYLDVLRAQKVLKNLRVLCVNRFGDTRSPSGVDNFVSLEKVSEKLGVNFSYINIHEYLDSMHPFESGKNYNTPGKRGLNPTEEDMAEIEKLADELMAGADECTMTREDVIKSTTSYYVTRKMLDAYECNGFCAICPDACATRRLNNERITFCMTHSLNNGCGIASACEYDLPAVVSKTILQALGHKPSYMGNTTMNTYFENANIGVGKFYDLENKIDDPKNTVLTWHAVTNLHMHGFDTPTEPYIIHPFTASGFGVTLRYDFARDIGQEVTMCRIDPSCSKLFVAKGKVAGCVGYRDDSCSIGVYLNVADGKDFFSKQLFFGNHVPLVYGDCFDKVCELGRVLGLEVITA